MQCCGVEVEQSLWRIGCFEESVISEADFIQKVLQIWQVSTNFVQYFIENGTLDVRKSTSRSKWCKSQDWCLMYLRLGDTIKEFTESLNKKNREKSDDEFTFKLAAVMGECWRVESHSKKVIRNRQLDQLFPVECSPQTVWILLQDQGQS